jgi:hypothetical protein
MDREFGLAITRNGSGWEVDRLHEELDLPPLGARLAMALKGVRDVWETASPEEREAFWNWLSE